MEFKGIAHSQFDLMLMRAGRRKKAEERVDVYEIPYSNNEPSIHTKTYKPYLRPMEFMLDDKTKRGAIHQWLDGYGKLRTEFDPGGYFKAEIIQLIESDKLAGTFDSMLVTFKINPGFFFLDSGDVPISLTAPGVINNPGTTVSDPLIRIVGSGNITLTINGRTMTFTGIETFLDIDPEITPSVFKNNENVGAKMVGDLPFLDIGNNSISWTGSVTEINILGRWREL